MLRIDVEDLQAQPHVVECSAPRHQAVVLEHDANLAAEEVEFPERIAPDHFDLAGTCLDQSGHNVEHRGLATAGFAKDSDDLAFGDFERQSVDSYKITASIRTLELLADVLEANDRIDTRHELHGPFRHRAIAQGPVLECRDRLLHHQNEQYELQGPGHGAGHVEQLLLPQQLIADAAGRADQFRNHHNAGGIAEINFPGRENAGHDSRHNQKPKQRPAGRSEHHGHLEQVLRHRAEGVKNLKSEGGQRRHDHDEKHTEFDAVKPNDGEHHP